VVPVEAVASILGGRAVLKVSYAPFDGTGAMLVGGWWCGAAVRVAGPALPPCGDARRSLN
jgi:hypothetical protein